MFIRHRISWWLQKKFYVYFLVGTCGDYLALYLLPILCFIADQHHWFMYVYAACVCVYESAFPCMWVRRLEVCVSRLPQSLSSQSLTGLSRPPEWAALGPVYPVLGTFTWVLEIQISSHACMAATFQLSHLPSIVNDAFKS